MTVNMGGGAVCVCVCECVKKVMNKVMNKVPGVCIPILSRGRSFNPGKDIVWIWVIDRVCPGVPTGGGRLFQSGASIERPTCGVRSLKHLE